MFTDLKLILAMHNVYNDHRLSRLMNEAASEEHRQLVVECKQLMDELICEVEALMDFVGRDMEKNLVGNVKIGAQLTLVEGTSMRVLFNALHQRCKAKRAFEELENPTLSISEQIRLMDAESGEDKNNGD